MNHNKFTQRMLVPFALLFLISLSVLTLEGDALAQDGIESRFERARESTVFLLQAYDLGGRQVFSCVGSGTIISPDGLILTAAHLATAGGPCRGERVIVALPVRLDDPPVPTYIAEVRQINESLDLAILQIIASLDGSLISQSALNLPWSPIGISTELLPGNTLTYVGYPNVAASQVGAIQGPITGLTSDSSGGSGAWFRVETPLGGGMSGGGAYNANGELVGVLNSSPITNGQLPSATCLSIQDNTGDGQITERDACVPIGDQITAIRPISYALPLINAARLGFEISHMPGRVFETPSINPSFGRMYVSEGVSVNGVATRITNTLPSGSTSVFVFFDYENMTFGVPFELEVSRDGLPQPQFGLGSLTWMGGPRGTWYIGTINTTWPDGNYEFTLLIEGNASISTSLTIGGVGSIPTVNDLTFGIPSDAGDLAFSGSLLPSEVPRVDGVFQFANIPDQQPWTENWYLDGTLVSTITRAWDNGSSGQVAVSAINFEGLPLGRYRLDILFGDQLTATGDVILAGGSGQGGRPLIFSNPRIASEISRDGDPAGQIGTVQPLGVPDLYLFVNWDLMPANTPWTYRWYLDGQMIAASSQRWDAGGVGEDFWINLHAPEALPEGTYAVEVLVANQPMFSQTVTVGSGSAPTGESVSEADDVFISGTVIDAITGNGIPGALVFILNVEFESAQFEWDESQILTQDITDQQGRFSLNTALKQSNFYTAFVFADGFITVLEDNFTIPRDTPRNMDITIEMSRP